MGLVLGAIGIGSSTRAVAGGFVFAFDARARGWMNIVKVSASSVMTEKSLFIVPPGNADGGLADLGPFVQTAVVTGVLVGNDAVRS